MEGSSKTGLEQILVVEPYKKNEVKGRFSNCIKKIPKFSILVLFLSASYAHNFSAFLVDVISVSHCF
jgi:hypothetical protein